MMDRGNLIVLSTKKRRDSETFVMGSDAAEFVNKVQTSWSMVQQVRLHHGGTLLGGAAQSVSYGGITRGHQGNLIKSTHKKWQIPKISSKEVMQQNLRLK